MTTIEVLSKLWQNRWVRIALFVTGVLGAFWFLLIYVPEHTSLKAETLVSLITGVLGALFFVWLIAWDKIKEVLIDVFASRNVAEIQLRGPIQETKPAGFFGGGDQVIPSEHVVKRVKKCAKKDFDAIIININSPGGYPVPSDDIRRALDDVDVPTYTYITSLCASGGYMIACGTDWIHARQDSLVGSIGVIANQYKFSGLADRLGVKMERFVGGEYKDTHRPLKELSQDEREYWQDVIDNSYENFVTIVANSRDLSPEEVKLTKAKVFDGTTALTHKLVDFVGPRANLLSKIREDTGLETLKIRKYDGAKKVWGNVESMFSSMAYAFGRGLGSSFAKQEERRIEYRF